MANRRGVGRETIIGAGRRFWGWDTPSHSSSDKKMSGGLPGERGFGIDQLAGVGACWGGILFQDSAQQNSTQLCKRKILDKTATTGRFFLRSFGRAPKCRKPRMDQLNKRPRIGRPIGAGLVDADAAGGEVAMDCRSGEGPFCPP